MNTNDISNETYKDLVLRFGEIELDKFKYKEVLDKLIKEQEIIKERIAFLNALAPKIRELESKVDGLSKEIKEMEKQVVEEHNSFTEEF